jgi:hypothetical protein
MMRRLSVENGSGKQWNAVRFFSRYASLLRLGRNRDDDQTNHAPAQSKFSPGRPNADLPKPYGLGFYVSDLSWTFQIEKCKSDTAI